MLIIECNPAFEPQLDQPYLEHLADVVLKGEMISDPVEISLLITDDIGISVLNQEYRNIDSATDVLSFSMLPGAGDPFITPPGEAKQLGDVIISYEHTIAQAAEYGHSVQQELGELFVHGLLHILGYDHEKAEDAQIMADKAEKYMTVA
jgi:probable rRNA maturation factor